jgi:hypothetical protein
MKAICLFNASDNLSTHMSDRVISQIQTRFPSNSFASDLLVTSCLWDSESWYYCAFPLSLCLPVEETQSREAKFSFIDNQR